jgi:nucleotide-binding universal stress UspA family protein
MCVSLLVPLDRSSLAEQALPWAIGIARQANAQLDLVEVHTLYALQDPEAVWMPYDHDRDAECKQQEQLYLDATAKWVTSLSPVSVNTSLLSGSAVLPETIADSILNRARTESADLIVMTTHGRSRLGCFAFGSVAEELVRRAPIPILLVRAGDKFCGVHSEPILDNILIPLDGSSLAERALEPAVELAQLMKARCSLLRVVEALDFGPDDLQEKTRAEAYLQRVAGKMRERGLHVQMRVVIADDVAKAILTEAEVEKTNLIALATHGRGGLKRLLLGSLADKLVRTATSPVLVCGPTGKKLDN